MPILSILGTKDDGTPVDAYLSTKLIQMNATKCPHFKGLVYEGAVHSFCNFDYEWADDSKNIQDLNNPINTVNNSLLR